MIFTEDKYYVFGCSVWGMLVCYDLLSQGKKVILVDNDVAKQCRELIHEVKCINPDDMNPEIKCIVALANENNRSSVINQLKMLGFGHFMVLSDDIMDEYINSLSDDIYIKAIWLYTMGYEIDLNNPKTFNEKLQWLKLFDRRPEYSMMVDKYEVKNLVSKIIGDEYIIPTIGIYEKFDEINFIKLPDRFVIKCTHDSGGIVICRDKSRFDKEAAREKIEKCIKKNFYWNGREWPYKNVKPRIIVENYMEDAINSEKLTDYKIHCFDGRPLYIQTICERNVINHTAKQRFYDFDWNDAGWQFGDFPPAAMNIDRPARLELMYEIAEKLCKNRKYIRVDLYEVNKRVYFGELTFYPLSGFYKYNHYWKYEDDLFLGNLINL